ncbi:MAG: hypothetical protein O9327_03170 [Polaromonas sp.]|nr:hypothetical protein [Polaromonas sp.]
MDFSPINVYQMFVENDQKLGFWLTRTSWNAKVARVTEVAPFKGPAPYFGNPKVKADLYDAVTGRLLEKGMEVTAAGTYKTWRLAEQPSWWQEPAA